MSMRQGEILCTTADGLLQISGVDLVGGDPRWCTYNLTGILDDGGWRGENIPISGIEGMLAFAHLDDETRRLLPLAITGWVDTHGNPVPVELAQAECNRAKAQLVASIIGAPDPDEIEGTRPAIYDDPDGTTYTADVQTLPLRKARTATGLWIGHLEIIWPQPWEASGP